MSPSLCGLPALLGGWLVEQLAGPAAELHASSAALLDPTDGGAVVRRVRLLHASRPAVVLGSAQPDEVVDRDRAVRLGFEVARRRSGGGAVLVGPGESVWVDLVVPRGDPLWSEDVGTSMAWVGQLWSDALAGIAPAGTEPAGIAPAGISSEGIAPAELSVWEGPMLRGPWSELVCFAGVGPGEVLLGPPGTARGGPSGPGTGRGAPGQPGPKLVGVSQRRSRAGALFQSAALLRWRPSDLLDALALDPSARRRALAEVAPAAQGLGLERSDAVVAAFLAALESRTGGPAA